MNAEGMMHNNPVIQMKELIGKIREADIAYYRDDAPIMTDREYDALVDELKKLEEQTGIVFANSPTRHVGGANKKTLRKVKHTKPMLSAKKTKDPAEIRTFAAGHPIVLSWKMDGLTLVMRYRNGALVQAITRGEDGLVGEDVTDAAFHLRNIPKKVSCTDDFEVRGEGVISWADFRMLNRNQSEGHPRNMAAGLVRAAIPDRGSLSHMDFYAFELIRPMDPLKEKMAQLDFLHENGFAVIDHVLCGSDAEIDAMIPTFVPDDYPYPVDGLIAEMNDLAYGRSLGRTEHHENRMIALKWSDELYSTIFRRVSLSTTRTGQISLTAEFDPVVIDGIPVRRADLRSLANFEKLCLGEGDVIRVYKANMVIPQIAENETRSGSYQLPEHCPTCGSKLELRISAGGSKALFCPNDGCIGKSAQRIARFCDRDAMDLEGFNASIVENLLAYGAIKDIADLYHLDKKRDQILNIPGIGPGSFEKMTESIKRSRHCRLCQFLAGIGIPQMSASNARAIDEYFYGSWDDFEKAVQDGFSFDHIAGISRRLSKNIHAWYENEEEGKTWRAVLREISLIGNAKEVGESGNPFKNANVVVTGSVNGMNAEDLSELLSILGAVTQDTVSKNTNYLIVGADPETEKLSAALMNGVKIITEGHFARMLSNETELSAE